MAMILERKSHRAIWREPALSAVALALFATLASGQQPPRFDERVNVARTIIDARVIDDRGDPVAGLTAADFKVTIDGQRARVETATWVGPAVPAAVAAAASAGALPGARPVSRAPGRLIVFLFQKDLEPSRIVGLMRMLFESRHLLATLDPADRIAILSFDSRLRIWTDFSNDRPYLDRVLEHGVLFERPPGLEPDAAPSLLERLDPRDLRHAHGIERALELIGRALEPLPGSKSLVLVGHGFGRLGATGVAMENDYAPARRALVASRTAVFSLDVTDADSHSLEAGLQLVADQTGGFYARTHLFPAAAMRQLSGALAASYVLFVDAPPSRTGSHALRVELTRGGGRILARHSLGGADR